MWTERDGQTKGYGEANSRFSQYCERAYRVIFHRLTQLLY